MNQKEKIEELYFKKQYNQKMIAEELGVSKQYVSKVLSENDNYIQEKNKRKTINQEKHRRYVIDYMNNKRRTTSVDMVYEHMKMQQAQDARELSGGKTSISNRAYRDWNKSAYKYDSKTKSYKLLKKLNAGADVPKRINWK